MSFCMQSSAYPHIITEGLKATEAEAVIQKGPTVKKKGKKSGSRQRPSKITNVHLRDIDLTRDYAPPSK